VRTFSSHEGTQFFVLAERTTVLRMLEHINMILTALFFTAMKPEPIPIYAGEKEMTK
jgi:hypothetical protein